MFIVIEGTDASGKSSLVAEMQKQVEAKHPGRTVEFFHKSKPEEMTRDWVLQDYVTSIENVTWTKRTAIADRWHWGEVTYAPLKRPESGSGDGYGLLGISGWRWTELFLKSRGVAQFWLYQPLDVITRRLESRGDDYIQANELETILGLYEAAAQVSGGLAGKLNPDPDSIQEIPNLARFVLSESSRISKECIPLADFPEYIGPRFPKVLLVGDRRNNDKTILPFMPTEGSSAEFLLSALPAQDWKTTGIVNGRDTNSHELDELWQVLGRPKIVALGRQAERALHAHNFDEDDYVVTSHPKNVLEFFNSRKTEYGQAISRLATTQDKEDQWILR